MAARGAVPPLSGMLLRLESERRRGDPSDGPRCDQSAEQAPDIGYGSTAAPPGMGPAPEKVREAGGKIVLDLQPPSWTTVEHLFAKLPEGGMFDPMLGPGRNFSFEIGAYRVPSGQALWLYDYEFWVNRLSGIDTGDAIRAEPHRYSDIIGFDININGMRRPGSLRFDLDPTPIETARPLFRTGTGAASGTTVAQARAQSFAATSGVGSSLLPIRPEVQGPRGEPFTWVVQEGDTVVLAATVFRAFKTPIASVNGRLAGYLVNQQASEALIRRTRPQ